MKSLLIITLLFFISEIKAIDAQCFGTISDINECIKKPTGMAHYGCCGVSTTRQSSTQNVCTSIPNTKAHREAFKKQFEEDAKRTNATIEMICPSQEDEIKGTCEEFKSIMVNEQKDCIKLTQFDKEKGCCGLKIRQKTSEEGKDLISNLCFELPNDKTKREEEIKKMEDETQGRMKVDDYLCSSEYLNLIMLTFIYSLFLVL